MLVIIQNLLNKAIRSWLKDKFCWLFVKSYLIFSLSVLSTSFPQAAFYLKKSNELYIENQNVVLTSSLGRYSQCHTAWQTHPQYPRPNHRSKLSKLRLPWFVAAWHLRLALHKDSGRDSRADRYTGRGRGPLSLHLRGKGYCINSHFCIEAGFLARLQKLIIRENYFLTLKRK